MQGYLQSTMRCSNPAVDKAAQALEAAYVFWPDSQTESLNKFQTGSHIKSVENSPSSFISGSYILWLSTFSLSILNGRIMLFNAIQKAAGFYLSNGRIQ